MKKSDLILRLAKENPHLTHRDSEKIVSCFFDTISEALAQGKRVELRGFGAFVLRNRVARKARNPRTGESVMVGERNIPAFKMGKAMHTRLNSQ
ncbi:MAG: integration host factor subunit beta [Proteobacteria bacterium]|nr:integration host factor subunit beta [Pseudomonadota bacterium]